MEMDYNANAWGHESILKFFESNRCTTKDIYPSEWLLIRPMLYEGITILDIGCAQGGMAKVVSEHISSFKYLGVDINPKMITHAKKRFPQHTFLNVKENDYSALGAQAFDLVLCLGILHLHETWRQTIAMAWKHTKKTLILDLRETHLQSIEDKDISFFKMDFDCIDSPKSAYRLPYNVINHTDAISAILDSCHGVKKLTHYGYTHPVSQLAVSPIKMVMANVYCIEKNEL